MLRQTRDQFKMGLLVFVRRAHIQHGQATYKCSPTAAGTYEVTPLYASTVTIEDRPNSERVFRDHTAQVPVIASGTPVVLNNTLHSTAPSNKKTFCCGKLT